jgi:methionyl-tRNA formyltransferase
MKTPRIVFMGTPDFAVPCLDMLVREHYPVVAVVTQPDRPKGRGQKLAFSPVKEAALVYELPVLQPQKVRQDEFQEQLAKLRPDLIIVVAFGQILPKSILDLPALGCVNVHASLLPSYRGAAPIHWAVIRGDKTTGITTMYMDVGMDTGDMILKAEVPIGENTTTGEVHDCLKEVGAEILKATIERILIHNAPRQAQTAEAATYAPMLTRQLEKIAWSQPAPQIHNLIRGLNPWPGAYCVYQGRILKIWQARVAAESAQKAEPGAVLKITEDGFIVQTGSGTLEILEVQPESKRRMSARDWGCGCALHGGEVLE